MSTLTDQRRTVFSEALIDITGDFKAMWWVEIDKAVARLDAADPIRQIILADEDAPFVVTDSEEYAEGFDAGWACALSYLRNRMRLLEDD